MNCSEDEFVRGHPVDYVGMDGRRYTATYLWGVGVRYIKVVDSETKRRRATCIASESLARSFFANLNKAQ